MFTTHVERTSRTVEREGGKVRHIYIVRMPLRINLCASKWGIPGA